VIDALRHAALRGSPDDLVVYADWLEERQETWTLCPDPEVFALDVINGYGHGCGQCWREVTYCYSDGNGGGHGDGYDDGNGLGRGHGYNHGCGYSYSHGNVYGDGRSDSNGSMLTL